MGMGMGMGMGIRIRMDSDGAVPCCVACGVLVEHRVLWKSMEHRRAASRLSRSIAKLPEIPQKSAKGSYVSYRHKIVKGMIWDQMEWGHELEYSLKFGSFHVQAPEKAKDSLRTDWAMMKGVAVAMALMEMGMTLVMVMVMAMAIAVGMVAVCSHYG